MYFFDIMIFSLSLLLPHQLYSMTLSSKSREYKKAYLFFQDDKIHALGLNRTQSTNTLFALCLQHLLTMEDAQGNTLLHRAAEKGDYATAQRLICAGIAINKKNKKKQTAANVAKISKQERVYRLLQANYNLLHLSYNQSPEKPLMEQAHVNVRTTRGQTPLLHLTWNYQGNINMKNIKTLLAAKASVNLQTDDGITALHNATYFGNLELTRMLINAQANVNIQNFLEETPLHQALYGNTIFGATNRQDIISLLIDAKADPMIENHAGQNALDINSSKFNIIKDDPSSKQPLIS